MGKKVRFYAVTNARCSGIFTSWSRVLDATVGYPGAKVDRFSTLAEAEQLMNENTSTTTRDNQVANGLCGPVYAVAVGRRMGIFTDRSEALCQTSRYSGNSLKKFPSYGAAVKFLDHHDWREVPPSNGSSGAMPSTDSVDDGSDAETSVGSSEELNLQNADRPEITPKRERDDEDHAAEIRPAQRRRVNSDPPVLKEGIYALCYGSLVHDSQGGQTVQAICEFPVVPEWNVLKTLHDPNLTATGAGLLAVLEALRRASREDPDSEVQVTIFTFNRPLFDVLCKCVDGGWQSVSQYRDLLKLIAQEKSGRCMKFLHVGGACKWSVERSDGNQQTET
ncbi:hypothetical protein KRP22_007787 [Phytophthora ramorum]|nr:hypothetical protein KRP22_4201 [Phytophthora ramorum]